MKLTSSSVANAIETFGVRLRNVGFSGPGIAPRTKLSAPMVGVAVTLKVRSADPSTKPSFYLEQKDWWELLENSPLPKVLVIEDSDAHPGRGALVGPAHGCIVKALGYRGVVTNGSVRGTRKLELIGLNVYSASVSPSHGYSHVLDIGKPVTVAGVQIENGEVIHGDQDGIVTIPADLLDRVAGEARRFMEREAEICGFCASPNFSVEGLRAMSRARSSR